MQNLFVLTHMVMRPLRFPDRIRWFSDVRYEEKMLERPYIGDQLDDEIKKWSCDRAVVIKAPTGSGKTWFVTHKIIKRAIAKERFVLIITNRNPLNYAYKKEVAKAVEKNNFYTPEGMQLACEFGNVFVVNYQALEGFLNRYNNINFSYVVCDEAHYFVQDACFSDCTGSVLDLIPKKFKNSVRIYVSATINEALPFITRAELYDRSFNKDAASYRRGMYYDMFNREVWLPIIYKMPADYSKVRLHFYEKLSDVTAYLKTLPTKSIIFHNSIEGCKKIAADLDDAMAIDSAYLHTHQDVLENLVEREKFDEKFLLTTSVFSNGNNIKDSRVRSVVITLLDPTEILQMAGRRRIDHADPDDGFTLYLPIPGLHELKNLFYQKQRLEKELKKCVSDEVYLMRVIKDGIGEFAEQVRHVFEVDWKTKTYKINYIAEDKLYADMKYIEFLHALISEEGAEAYCNMVASLFDKEFDTSMLFGTLDDKKQEFTDFIRDYGFPLTADEFEGFKTDFLKERIRLFGAAKADNMGGNRKIPGIRAINSRLTELDIPIQIGCEHGKYILNDTSEQEVINEKVNFDV